MKKKILLLMGIFSIGILHAQVGINTKTPLGVLHVDPKGDTAAGTGMDDDIIITSNGNVGVGTISPTEKLHVNGKVRIADGTQRNGYVLTSDNQGNGRWEYMASTLRVAMEGFSPDGVSIPLLSVNNSNISAHWFSCNTYIDISHGKQLITATLYTSLEDFFLGFTGSYKIVYRLSTSSTALIDPVFAQSHGGQQVSSIGNFPNFSTCNTGFWLVNNLSPSTQRLYLWVAVYFPVHINTSTSVFSKVGGYYWLENIVTVSPFDTDL